MDASSKASKECSPSEDWERYSSAGGGAAASTRALLWAVEDTDLFGESAEGSVVLDSRLATGFSLEHAASDFAVWKEAVSLLSLRLSTESGARFFLANDTVLLDLSGPCFATLPSNEAERFSLSLSRLAFALPAEYLVLALVSIDLLLLNLSLLMGTTSPMALVDISLRTIAQPWGAAARDPTAPRAAGTTSSAARLLSLAKGPKGWSSVCQAVEATFFEFIRQIANHGKNRKCCKIIDY